MERIELLPERPAHGGYVIARVPDDAPDGRGGKVALVAGALPGERVVAEIVDEQPRLLTARVVDVLEASPDRVPHVWPLAATHDVGGADLGHVAPEAQLRWKNDVIADVMRRIGGPAVAAAVGDVAIAAVPGGTTHWRTRVNVVADPSGRPAMRRERSHDLVALDDMPLAVPELDALGLFSGGWEFTPGEEVRAVVPSASEPVVVTDAGVWRAPGVAARTRVIEQVGEDRYEVSAGGFWQAHREAPRALVEAVLAATPLQSGDRVLELYSGAGLLTRPLARAVGRTGVVTALEGTKRAVADARRNLADLPWATATATRVDPRSVARAARHDVVVLDPPRTGAGLKVTRALRELAPRHLTYVACDPAALARDLKDLLAAYELTSVRALDLFPSTHHMELVVGLRSRR